MVYSAFNADFDEATLTFTYAIAEASGPPRFADATPLTWVVDLDSEGWHDLRLPEVKGGDPPLQYGINPPLPKGVSFDPDKRLLPATPIWA